MNDSPVREDVRAILQVEAVDVPGSKEGPPVLAGRGNHGRDQPAGARPGDAVEVVGQPCIWPVQLLQPRLQEGQDGARDEAADAAPVDGQDRHPLPRRHRLADDATCHRLSAARVAGPSAQVARHFSATTRPAREARSINLSCYLFVQGQKLNDKIY
jgi:hypothetical protein